VTLLGGPGSGGAREGAGRSARSGSNSGSVGSGSYKVSSKVFDYLRMDEVDTIDDESSSEEHKRMVTALAKSGQLHVEDEAMAKYLVKNALPNSIDKLENEADGSTKERRAGLRSVSRAMGALRTKIATDFGVQ